MVVEALRSDGLNRYVNTKVGIEPFGDPLQKSEKVGLEIHIM